MQVSIKLFFENDIRRVAIGDESGNVTFPQLRSAIDEIFPVLRGGNVKVSWKDEDGDLITISTTPELQEAVRALSKDGGLVKLNLTRLDSSSSPSQEEKSVTTEQLPSATKVDADSSEPPAIHHGVGCNECGVSPIVGNRYKCTVRYDYDLCGDCEAKKPQPHPMVKIARPFGFGGIVKDDQNVPTAPPAGIPGSSRFGCAWGGYGPTPEGGRFGGRQWHAGVRGHHGWRGHHGMHGGRGGLASFMNDLPSAAPQSGPSSRAASGTASTAEPVEAQVLHPNVQCNECGICPIAGPRFKCTVRKNFDLCTKCESKHRTRLTNPELGTATGVEMCPLLKIFHPDQAPVEETFSYSFAKHNHALLYKDLYRGSKHSGVLTLPPAVHRFIRCDMCGTRPITGVRFKCTVRPDYDLCENCEQASRPQPYPMVKIYRARHRPAQVMYQPLNPVAATRFAQKIIAQEAAKRAAAAATPVAGTSAKPAVKEEEVHRGVTCDECGMFPIIGTRYKCTKRHNFDLCSGCEGRRAVQPYPMVKITRGTMSQIKQLRYEFENKSATASVDANGGVEPVVITKDDADDIRGSSTTAPDGKERPILIQVHHGVRCDECSCFPIVGPRYKCTVKNDYDLCGACEEKKKATYPYPLVKIYDPAHHPSLLVCVFDQLPNFAGERHMGNYHCYKMDLSNEEAVDQLLAGCAPPFVPTAATAVRTLPKPALRFVRDLTLPDGTVVDGGSINLKKVWQVRNDGNHQWPAGCKLVFAGGDVLHVPETANGASSSSTSADNTNVAHVAMTPVPLLKPNEEGELFVHLNTPMLPGRFVSYFRMQTAEGQNFGQRLWSDLVVTLPSAEAEAAAVAVEPGSSKAEVTGGVAMVDPTHAPDTTATTEVTIEEDADLAEALRESLTINIDRAKENSSSIAAPVEPDSEPADLEAFVDAALQEALTMSSAPASPSVKAETASVTSAENLPHAESEWVHLVAHDCSELIDGLLEHETQGAIAASYATSDATPLSNSILHPTYENASADVDFAYDSEAGSPSPRVVPAIEGKPVPPVTADAAPAAPVDPAVEDEAANNFAIAAAAAASFLTAMDQLAATTAASNGPGGSSSSSSSSSSESVPAAPFIYGMDQLSAAAPASPGKQTTQRVAWKKEIAMIRDMGFCADENEVQSVLIPLLQRYVCTPAETRPGQQVNTEGLHSVLSVLLSRGK